MTRDVFQKKKKSKKERKKAYDTGICGEKINQSDLQLSKEELLPYRVKINKYKITILKSSSGDFNVGVGGKVSVDSRHVKVC